MWFPHCPSRSLKFKVFEGSPFSKSQCLIQLCYQTIILLFLYALKTDIFMKTSKFSIEESLISSIYFRNHFSIGLPLTWWHPMPLKNEFRPYSFLSHSEYYGSVCRICQSYIETNSIHRCLQLWPHSFSRKAFDIHMFISFPGLSVLCPVFLALEAFFKDCIFFLTLLLYWVFFGNFKLIINCSLPIWYHILYIQGYIPSS